LDEVTPAVAAAAGGGASAAVGFPATNTQLLGRGDVWRSSDTSQTGGALAAQEWKYTYGSDRAANFLALFGHNLAGGTARLQLYSDAAWSSSVYDSTALTVPAASSANAGASYGRTGLSAGNSDDLFGDIQPYVLYFTGVAFRSVKINLTTGSLSTADGFLELGRPWLALYAQLNNPDYGMSKVARSNTVNTRTRGGSLRGNAGETWRVLDVNLGTIQDSGERVFWDDVTRYAQNSRDLFISVFDGSGGRLERDYCMDGKIVELNPLIYSIAYRSQHMIVEEL
jgi:hypothetical protein